jgi:hypothetical protein
LKRIAGGSFEKAVDTIAAELHRAADGKHRLTLLMNRWEFLLPTATTVLSFLYPDEFTIFDWRVCDELKFDYEPWCWRGFSEELWKYYETFVEAVRTRTPRNLSLQQKDRFLIGRSYRKSIEVDCKK